MAYEFKRKQTGTVWRVEYPFQWWIQDFPEVGVPTYDFGKISQKLKEIERIWTGGHASLEPTPPPLRSTNVLVSGSKKFGGNYTFKRNRSNAVSQSHRGFEVTCPA